MSEKTEKVILIALGVWAFIVLNVVLGVSIWQVVTGKCVR